MNSDPFGSTALRSGQVFRFSISRARPIALGAVVFLGMFALAQGDGEIVQKTVETKVKAQPKLTLMLRLPAGKTSGQEVSGVLAYCTWEQDSKSILAKIEDGSGSDEPPKKNEMYQQVAALKAFADEQGLALLTWNTATVWNKRESADEMRVRENKGFDKNFDLLAAAWEKGVAELARETGIPTQDYLLYGISRGAQWAHRLALRKPVHFLGVHAHINSSYDQPTPAGANTLWLMTTGDREAGYPASTRFYAECRALGYPIILKAGENLGHSGSPEINRLQKAFFNYALSIKARVQAVRARGNLAQLDPAGREPLLRDFRAAPFVGDYVTNEVVPADDADWIPEEQRVPLPTAEIAKAWGWSSRQAAR